MISPRVAFLFQLYLTGRKIRGKFKHRNEDGMLQITIFILLNEKKRTVSQLSELLSTKVSAISEKIIEMEKEGIVKKTKENDGRESYIELTRKGKDTMAQALLTMEENCAVLMEKLTENEMSLLIKALKKIAD